MKKLLITTLLIHAFFLGNSQKVEKIISFSIQKITNQKTFRKIIGISKQDEDIFVGTYSLDKGWSNEKPNLVLLKVYKINTEGRVLDSLEVRNPSGQGIDIQLARMVVDGDGNIVISFFEKMSSNQGITQVYSNKFKRLWGISTPYNYIHSYGKGFVASPPGTLNPIIVIYDGNSKSPIFNKRLSFNSNFKGFPLLIYNKRVFFIDYDSQNGKIIAKNLLDATKIEFNVGSIDFGKSSFSINSSNVLALLHNKKVMRELKKGRKPKKTFDRHLSFFDEINGLVMDTVLNKSMRRNLRSRRFGEPANKLFCWESRGMIFFDKNYTFIAPDEKVFAKDNNTQYLYYSQQTSDEKERVFLVNDRDHLEVVRITDE